MERDLHIDEAIRRLVRPLDPEQRLMLAERFDRWVLQLRRAVAREPTEAEFRESSALGIACAAGPETSVGP